MNNITIDGLLALQRSVEILSNEKAELAEELKWCSNEIERLEAELAKAREALVEIANRPLGGIRASALARAVLQPEEKP